MQDRFFYHNFPRRGASTEIENAKGIKILSAIKKYGLLLTPEKIEWGQENMHGVIRTQPHLQTRVCFTELSPQELPEHATKFGKFALEFDIDSVRQLGGMPVFYIPQPIDKAFDGSAVGAAFYSIIFDAMNIIERMAILEQLFTKENVPEFFDFDIGFSRTPAARRKYKLNREETKQLLRALSHELTPLQDLYVGTNSLMNLFYPTDNTIKDKALEYYRQREWRIATNFSINKPDGTSKLVMHLPTSEERDIFKDIDQEFFNRKFIFDTNEIQTLDASLVHPGINDKKIMDFVNRVIVPVEAKSEAIEMLSDMNNPPEVVSYNEIA